MSNTCTITCATDTNYHGYRNNEIIPWYIIKAENLPTNSSIDISLIRLEVPNATIKSGIQGIYLYLGKTNYSCAYINNIPLINQKDYSTSLVPVKEYIPSLIACLNSGKDNIINNLKIRIESGTVSQAFLAGNGEFTITIDYDYLITPPTSLSFSNGSKSLNTSINSQIKINWTKPTTGTISNYNIYYNNVYLKQVAGSQTSATIDIPGNIANAKIWNIGLKSIDAQGNASELSGTIKLTIYQPIQIINFCVKNEEETVTYEPSNYQIGAYNAPKCNFTWDYNKPDNRSIKNVKFINKNLATTDKSYSKDPITTGTYYVEITDQYDIVSRSNDIIITEYTAKNYNISISSPSAEADGRITTNSFELTLPSDYAGKDLTYGYINNNITNKITDNTFEVDIGINTKFNLYIKYNDPAPMGGYSSRIISLGSFYIYSFPNKPEITGVQDENYEEGAYIYQNLKVFINPATKTNFSGSNFSYSITLNDITSEGTITNSPKTISGLTVKTENNRNFLIVPLTNSAFQGLSDTFKVTGISVFDIDCAKTLQGIIEKNPTKLYRLKLPTVTINKVSVQQESATENATNNKITVNFTISSNSNITGSTGEDCKVKLLVGKINTTQEALYRYDTIKDKSQSLSITIKLTDTNSLLYKAVITNQNPAINDIITASFSFNNYEKYSSQASSAFNYNFVTKPTYGGAFKCSDASAIPMTQFKVSSNSAINFYDAAGISTGESKGYSSIELKFVPKDGSSPTKVTNFLGNKLFYCIYQSYSNTAKTIYYNAVFTVRYKSGLSYTYSSSFSVNIAKWTPEQAQIIKADENGIVFKFPSRTPCGDNNSFNEVILTIKEGTTTYTPTLEITENNFSTYTWETKPTTDTSYNITLTYYNKKGSTGTIVQTFNNYIVHISGATIAVRKQFLGINVTEDYGTGTVDLNSYPIIAINSLKDLADTTPILKISTSGNDSNKETKLLYFNSGKTTSIGGFFKSNDNKGFIAENLLGIKNDNTVTKFSDFLTNGNAESIYLKKTDAESTYLTESYANSKYLIIANATNTYLTKDDAKKYYLTKGTINDSEIGEYLWTSNRIANYVTNRKASKQSFTLDVSSNDGWTEDTDYDDYYQNYDTNGKITSIDQEISISCIPCATFPITAARIIIDNKKYYLQIRMVSPPESSQTITVSVITIPK